MYCFKIKEAREEKQMTQEELAKRSGVSRSIISGLEQGKIKVIKTSTLVSIANALETTVGKIFLVQ